MISVVLPVYNVEKYLPECLDSLINQSYKDIEIIIVNDGSTDNSEAICREYALKNKNIKLYTKQNAGLGYARNTGIEHANGEYVLFLDSDDVFKKELVENLVEGIDENRIDTCVGGFERISEEGKDIGSYGKADIAEYCGDEIMENLLPRLFGSSPDKQDGIVISACNTLYSMKIIKINNLRFESEREYTSEDLFFNLEYFKYSTGVRFNGCRDYLYRINPTSLSHKYRQDRFEMKQKIYIEGCKRLKNAGIYENTKYRFMKYYLIGMKLCIRQEIPKVSGKTYHKCINSIRTICSNAILKEIIQEYPVSKLRIKQKLFVFLLKYRCANILCFFSMLGTME
ncbi:MAG: glycosyltransferase [Lachnospiraceae bacterium]|nr:glycosyltransferase [Lachnospiraceae bacterium]